MALKVKKNIDENDKDILDQIDKVDKEVKKEEKKKEKKKDDKKESKKEVKKVEKESWWHGVKSEFKKVRWPNKKEMLKYSIATIIFIIFFALFFYLIELAVYFIKTM